MKKTESQVSPQALVALLRSMAQGEDLSAKRGLPADCREKWGGK